MVVVAEAKSIIKFEDDDLRTAPCHGLKSLMGSLVCTMVHADGKKEPQLISNS